MPDPTRWAKYGRPSAARTPSRSRWAKYGSAPAGMETDRARETVDRLRRRDPGGDVVIEGAAPTAPEGPGLLARALRVDPRGVPDPQSAIAAAERELAEGPGLSGRALAAARRGLDRAIDLPGERADSETARLLDDALDRAGRPAGPRLPGREASRIDPAYAAEAPYMVGRGLSEVGHRTGTGLAELVGADDLADAIRRSRQQAREWYGEPETTRGRILEGATQMGAEGALFLVPGAGATRLAAAAPTIARGSALAGRLIGEGTRGGRALEFLAQPKGFLQRAAQNLVTGAPIDAAIAAGAEEDETLTAAAAAGAEAIGAGSLAKALRRLNETRAGRVAGEVGLGFAAGELLGEGLHALGGRGRAGTAPEAASTRAARRQAAREAAPPTPDTPPVEIGTQGAIPRAEPEAPATPAAEGADWRTRRIAPVAAGDAESTFFPGDRSKVRTRYVLVEADELVPSHDPESFAPAPAERYPAEIQGRAYHGERGRAAREEVVLRSSTWDPELGLAATGTAEVGPPVIHPSGVVVAGNQRAMMAQRVARHAPDRFGQYRELLKERAARFGLDPAAVDQMRNPVVARVLDDAALDLTDVETLRRLNASSDAAAGKTKDVESDAATRAAQLRSAGRALEHFARTIQPEQTLRAYLDSSAGRDFGRELVADGVITEGERARYFTPDGGATKEGKQLLERMMYAAAVGDPDVVVRAPEGILSKLDTSLPAIVRASRVEGWDVGPTVRSALDMLAAARASDMTLREFAAQGDNLSRSWDERTLAMAEFLEGARKAEIAEAFRGYAAEAEAAARATEAEDLFGYEPRAPEQALAGRFERRRAAALVPQKPERPTPEAALDRAYQAFRDRDPLQATTIEDFLARVEADPDVQRARTEGRQPGPGDTWDRLGQDPARVRLQEEKARHLDENRGFADLEKKRKELLEKAMSEEERAAINTWADNPPERGRQAFVIMGPPASGKSTIADPIAIRHGAMVIDSDEAKKLLPEYDDGRNAGGVHRESSHIADDLMERATARGDNIVHATVGRDLAGVEAEIDELIGRGYDVHLVINELPPLEAAKRAYNRFRATGRYVDFHYIVIGVSERPAQNFQTLKLHPGVTSYRRYSNDVPRGQEPLLLEEGGRFPEAPGGRTDVPLAVRSPAVRLGGVGDRASPRAVPPEARAPGAAAEGLPGEVTPTSRPGPGQARALVPPDNLDMFGEAPPRPAPEEPAQGSLFAESRGPQGITQAETEARQVVSLLEGKVARGAASAGELRRYADARAVLRRLEKMSAKEVASGRARAEGQETLTTDDTADLFAGVPTSPTQGVARGLVPAGHASERLPDAGRFASGASETAPKVSEIQRELERALETRVKEGGIRGLFKRLGALGIYEPDKKLIRLGRYGDIGTLGHEIGHALHRLLFGTTRGGALSEVPLRHLPAADELARLAEGISNGDLAEGWAEFWRRYIDNPDVLPERAPETLAYVQERLAIEFPEIGQALDRAREQWRLHREGATAEARVDSHISIGRQPRNWNIRDAWRRLRTDVIDQFDPVERVVRKLANGQPVVDEDAASLARLVNGATGTAEHFLEHGTLDFATLQPIGKSLREILDPVRLDLDRFRRYIVSRRVVELAERKRTIRDRTGRVIAEEAAPVESGIRVEDAREVVEQTHANDVIGPAFRKAFDELQEYQSALLDYLREAGVLSDRSLEAIRELNKNYVPFYRVTEGGAGAGGMGQTFGHLFNPVKRIRGSGRDLVDPLESIIKNTYAYTQLAARQQVSEALARLAERPDAGALLEQIIRPIKPVRFRLGEIEGALRRALGEDFEDVLAEIRRQADEEWKAMTADLGTDELAALRRRGVHRYDPAEEVLAIFRPAELLGKPNIISVLRGGERQYYEVAPELYEALQGLRREDVPGWAKLLGFPVKTLRAGSTLAPEFQLRNPIRDQVMAWIQSEYGYVPVVDMVRGALEILSKGEAYQQWLAAGGARASLLSLDRNAMRNSLQQLTRSGGVPNVLRNPLDMLRAISALMEDATRVGEFMNARAALGTSKEGLQRAALASREISVDFARHGAALAALRHITAFWNARLQGYDRLARAARRDPVRFAAKATLGITLPSVLLHLANRDEEGYAEIPQWQKDLFWLVKVGDTWLRIPKPFELGLIFGSLPERILEAVLDQDPEGAQRFFMDTLAKEGASILPFPTAALPLLENVVNYSFFLQRPIVPRGQEEVEPRYQFDERSTSEVAELLGRWSAGPDGRGGISPRKIDNLLFAWTGGLGRLATQTIDVGTRPFRGEPAPPAPTLADVPGVRGLVAREPGFSSESVERFHRRLSEVRSAEATMRHLERSGQREELRRYREDPKVRELLRQSSRFERTAERISELRDRARAIEQNPRLDRKEKRRRLREVEQRAMKTAQEAIRR